MKKISCLILIFFTNWFLGNAQDNYFRPEFRTVIDSGNAKVVLYQCSRIMPSNVKKFWTLKQSDVEALEKNFKKMLCMYSTGPCNKDSAAPYLNKYAFQYAGFIIKNKKFIYLNAFSINTMEYYKKEGKDWQTLPVVVCDGGQSFWGILFSMEEEKFSDRQENGMM